MMIVLLLEINLYKFYSFVFSGSFSRTSQPFAGYVKTEHIFTLLDITIV